MASEVMEHLMMLATPDGGAYQTLTTPLVRQIHDSPEYWSWVMELLVDGVAEKAGTHVGHWACKTNYFTVDDDGVQ